MNSVTLIADIPPLDCRRILGLLNEKGRNNAEIANVIGAEPSTVRQWKRGKCRPGEPYNRRLLAMFDLYYPGEKYPELREASHAQEEMTAV